MVCVWCAIAAYFANAMFLEMRGWARSHNVPDGAPRRPDADREVLRDIGERLGVL